jgi:hypothetical protein
LVLAIKTHQMSPMLGRSHRITMPR